jgi:hypothetical protein
MFKPPAGPSCRTLKWSTEEAEHNNDITCKKLTNSRRYTSHMAHGDVVLESKGVVFSRQIEKLKPISEQQHSITTLNNKSASRVRSQHSTTQRASQLPRSCFFIFSASSYCQPSVVCICLRRSVNQAHVPHHIS